MSTRRTPPSTSGPTPTQTSPGDGSEPGGSTDFDSAESYDQDRGRGAAPAARAARPGRTAGPRGRPAHRALLAARHGVAGQRGSLRAPTRQLGLADVRAGRANRAGRTGGSPPSSPRGGTADGPAWELPV
jgi:hypothetical protein